jgi:hypothetical protein
VSYRNLGFKSDPFDTKALQRGELGEALLVNREKEIAQLIRRVQESDKIPTLEGANGIGKTSIINIALHRLLQESKAEDAKPMFLPCRCSFQIGKGKDLEDFMDEVYLQIALTLIENATSLRPPPGYTKAPIEASIQAYIQSPIIRSYTASILGHGGGVNNAPNTGKGWERVGFRAAIEGWLKVLFPTHETGAVVCVIDNLEILQSSEEAKSTIEALRDTAFSVPGVKWILCGAAGVVRGVALSPRMVGCLHRPINVGELSEESSGDFYDKRKAIYRTKADAQLPITRDEFMILFDIFNGNARFTLDEAGAFCTWVFDEVDDLQNIPHDAFERWLNDELEKNYDEIFVFFLDKEKEAFKKACQLEIFLASDAGELGMDDTQEFKSLIDKFIKHGLVTPSLDQDDSERAVYEISPKSLKLQYFLDSQA